jgi:hypothetical protein
MISASASGLYDLCQVYKSESMIALKKHIQVDSSVFFTKKY